MALASGRSLTPLLSPMPACCLHVRSANELDLDDTISPPTARIKPGPDLPRPVSAGQCRGSYRIQTNVVHAVYWRCAHRDFESRGKLTVISRTNVPPSLLVSQDWLGCPDVARGAVVVLNGQCDSSCQMCSTPRLC